MPFGRDTRYRDPVLRDAYRTCRALHAAHGRTYFLATRLLTAAQRPAIHALYGFARWVDDLVDDCDPLRTTSARRAELDGVHEALMAGLRDGESRHPVLAAVLDTAVRYRLDHALFTDFLTSMRMDLEVTDYPTRAELQTYVHGSAEVIGLQVLPVLGTVGPEREAARYAAALGNAFQLTNFLRDVGEDLDRGRIYFPADELAAFDVDRERLSWCHRRGRADRQVRRALADQVARIRAVYRAAEPGIDLLAPVSRPCVRTARVLYGEIVDRVVESGYDVFQHRVSVSTARRSGVAAHAVSAAATARVRARLTR